MEKAEAETQVKMEEPSVDEGSMDSSSSSDESSGSEEDSPPEKKTPKLIMNIGDTKYPVVKHVAKKMLKWKVTKDIEDKNFDLFWTDQAIVSDQLSRLAVYQKINHFPGMFNLARKNHLAMNLNKLRKAFPEEYSFFPKTWILPADKGDLVAQFKDRKPKTFILKPQASCQGRGIMLVQHPEQIPDGEPMVAQRYVLRPYLLDGLKFDLRIYFLVAGSNPLRLFIYKEGMARLATNEYEAPSRGNVSNLFMHLTNYAINKFNDEFQQNDGVDQSQGHKRLMSWVWEHMAQNGVDTKLLWKKIKQLALKTLCAAQPQLAHHYSSGQSDDYYSHMCFEILGFDVLIDAQANPILIEVNHTPSFSTDSKLDFNLKSRVIYDAIVLMHMTEPMKNKLISKKKKEAEQRVITGKRIKLTPEQKDELRMQCQKERDKWISKHLGGYEQIYPLPEGEVPEEPYEEFMSYAKKEFEIQTGANKRQAKKEDIPTKAAFGSRIPIDVGPQSVKTKDKPSGVKMQNPDTKQLGSKAPGSTGELASTTKQSLSVEATSNGVHPNNSLTGLSPDGPMLAAPGVSFAEESSKWQGVQDDATVRTNETEMQTQTKATFLANRPVVASRSQKSLPHAHSLPESVSNSFGQSSLNNMGGVSPQKLGLQMQTISETHPQHYSEPNGLQGDSLRQEIISRVEKQQEAKRQLAMRVQMQRGLMAAKPILADHDIRSGSHQPIRNASSIVDQSKRIPQASIQTLWENEIRDHHSRMTLSLPGVSATPDALNSHDSMFSKSGSRNQVANSLLNGNQFRAPIREGSGRTTPSGYPNHNQLANWTKGTGPSVLSAVSGQAGAHLLHNRPNGFIVQDEMVKQFKQVGTGFGSYQSAPPLLPNQPGLLPSRGSRPDTGSRGNNFIASSNKMVSNLGFDQNALQKHSQQFALNQASGSPKLVGLRSQ